MTQLAIGKPAPLGAHYDGQGVNFTLFSAHAERVELCIFDANGQEHRYDLPGHSGDIWHGYLPDARPGLRYGYRVHGPWQPAEGHRFNPAKLLIDPCARQIDGEFKDNPLLHAGHNEPDYRDNAAIAPKCVVVVDHYDWEDDAPPRTPWGSTIIYEAHVKGLTYLHPEIPVEIRGTYKALGHPVMINYLKQLGITALELLPVAQFASEPRLQRMGLSNYWGYNPVAMFALHPAYACSPETALDEFRDAIKALHKAGIEVILDIVLNHSAELDLDGPLFSLRGIDNRSYYWIREDGDYHNWTGCGNTLNLSHPAVVDYASACLRYWVETCHVDGFRFDLAAVMGRTPEFRQDAPLFTAIQNCPVLSQVKLIAEPWDIAPGGYQVGNFPPLFAEWNDHFRDAARRFWLHYDLPLGAFAGRFAASSDVFKRNGRLPSAAINLVTAHDGFTLRDCVCFNHKHNEANGEENRDGTNNNYSNNHGKEGLGGTLDLVERRRDSIHALLTTLLLSQGTPMLLAGDEHGHSQHGNNNAYCQDNQLTWLDWSQASSGLTAFTAALIHLRKRIPALVENRWWEEGDGNVRWLNRYAQPLSTDEWQNGPKQLQILLSDRFLIAINATLEVTEIVLPAGEWHAIPLNLKNEHYEDFARFLANVIKGVEKKDGIKFDYLSPFNEPDGHWNWIGPKQEGTPATKKEIARAVRLISKEFVKEGIHTGITICEASDYRCMFATHMTDHERGYEIQSFFCPDSVDTYLGNTPNVLPLISGHSYWTTTPLNMLRDYRLRLRNTLDTYGVDFWQSETCIMGNDEEIGGGHGFDRTMKTALYVARIIHQIGRASCRERV